MIAHWSRYALVKIFKALCSISDSGTGILSCDNNVQVSGYPRHQGNELWRNVSGIVILGANV